ncbi:8071_t:CDS:1, partial [Ambispora gerdemannii]
MDISSFEKTLNTKSISTTSAMENPIDNNINHTITDDNKEPSLQTIYSNCQRISKKSKRDEDSDEKLNSSNQHCSASNKQDSDYSRTSLYIK